MQMAAALSLRKKKIFALTILSVTTDKNVDENTGKGWEKSLGEKNLPGIKTYTIFITY